MSNETFMSINSVKTFREKLEEIIHEINELKLYNSNIRFMYNIFPINQQAITIIKFIDCKIEVIVKKTFYNLLMLKELNLTLNKIRSVNEEIFGKNRELETLIFENNRLERVSKQLFKNNKKMKHLDLQKNCLKTFNNHILRNVTTILLNNNLLVQFSNNNFPQLLSLNLSFNKLRKLNQSQFKWSPKLDWLSVDNNLIDNYEVTVFSPLRKLKYLSLNKNRFEVLHELMFFNNHNLFKLDLSDNNIMFLHNNLFSNCQQLKILNLNGNRLEKINLIALKYFHDLNELSIDRNNINEFILISNLSIKIRIKVIKLQNNRNLLSLENNVFRNFITLKRISFTNSNITNIEENVFRNLKSLNSLSLNKNRLEELPYNFLPTETEIIILDLSHNKLKCLQKEHFAPGTIVKFISLSSNRNLMISDNAFINISPHLQLLEINEISFENHKLPYLNYLHQLVSIKIISCYVREFPDVYFQYLTNLQQLIFTNITKKSSSEKTKYCMKPLEQNQGYVFESFNKLEYPLLINPRNVLVYIDFENCKIAFISAQVFKYLLLLQFLNLKNNCLQWLDRNLFDANVNLKCLNLSKNPLRNFICNHFVKNSKLYELHLATETITHLKGEHLNLTNLRLLFLNPQCKCDDTLKNSLTLKIVIDLNMMTA